MHGLKNDLQTLYTTIDNLASELAEWIKRHESSEEQG